MVSKNNEVRRRRRVDEILEIIHKGMCPRGFWARENRNEQEMYIIKLVETELNIRTPTAYLCLFHINDLLKINTTIVNKFGMTETYKLLERHFKIPSYLLSSMKNIPYDKKSEYNDFCKRIKELAYNCHIKYDNTLTTNRTDYIWYNLFDPEQATIIAKMYKNKSWLKEYINKIFYNRIL